MMLVFVILGGPKVQGAKYRTVIMSITVLVLVFGFIASLVYNLLLKTTCFTFGAFLFGGIIYIIDRSVLEHSQGKESLFKSDMSAHASWYKALAKKIFFTWILFPIWWVMSPEGFALATDSHDVDAMVKLFLNCFAKGLYVLFIRSLQARFKDETETSILPVSHPAEKDTSATLENFGKYSDEQCDWSSSNNGDIESGNAPAVLAVVDHQKTSQTSLTSDFGHAGSDKSFNSQTSTRSGSKVSRSASKESLQSAMLEDVCKKQIVSRSSSMESLEDICKKQIEERQASMSLEAPSMPSERQLDSEEQPPPSDTWQEFQCIKVQMEI
jgi:hypothetical protein